MAKQKAQGAAQAKAVSRHPGGVRKVRVSKKNGAHFKRQHRLPVDLDMMISSSKVQEQPKYKSEFIKVPNLDKKEKKLEYRMTKSQDPPPGFSFIPVGNPELSNACKEISREKEYLIFVVTVSCIFSSRQLTD